MPPWLSSTGSWRMCRLGNWTAEMVEMIVYRGDAPLRLLLLLTLISSIVFSISRA